MKALKLILCKDDALACVLAGRSTGKSLVFRALAAENAENLVVVNMRENNCILSGLFDVLQANEKIGKQIFTREFMYRVNAKLADPRVNFQLPELVEYFGDMLFGHPLMSTAFKTARILENSHNGKEKFLQMLLNELADKLDHPTILIDEADLALTLRDKEVESRNAKTKEKRKVI